MKLAAKSWYRGLPLGCLASLLAAGCGGSASNPKAVSWSDLKFPSGLTVHDNGNGKATLTWYGSNNESKFSGYNVYGMIDDASGSLSKLEGQSIQLLDDQGNPSTDGKATMQKFSYNGSDFESAAPAPATKSGSDQQFSYSPVYSAKDDKGNPVVPTCIPNPTSGNCDANKGTATSSTPELDGKTSYQVSGLKPGSKYCFFVLSVEGDGSKVSQNSSEVRCIVPKYDVATTLTTGTTAMDGSHPTTYVNEVDWLGYLKSCTQSGTCPDMASFQQARTSGTTSGSTIPMSVDGYAPGDGSDQNVYFVAGKNCAVQDLGFYTGFDDASLPASAPTLTLDPNLIQDKDGYSIPGQSLLVQQNHMYVVAVSDPNATTTPTTFNYHWIYVKDAPAKGTPFSVEIRLSKNAQ